MYLNFHKYNYNLLSPHDVAVYEERDKNAYKEILKSWFDQNIEKFVDRKWEIEEIHYLKEIGDFIKLLREAEQLYEFGFFTSCIALVGVSAEDFSKYISLRGNFNDHITDTNNRGRTVDVSQYNRLQLQLAANLIHQTDFDLLDEIRSIRNDCLHYNQNFKQKPDDELKNDAIKVLNNLKAVLKNVFGDTVDANDYKELLTQSFAKENSRSTEELVWKHRNMFSHLLKFNIAHAPSVSVVNKYDFYEVTDIDDDEIELSEIDTFQNSDVRLFVWVDIDETGETLIEREQLSAGDIVFAHIYSNVDANGQTGIWSIKEIQKV
ncbi:hypothetical protein [Sphingobacterium siyangense]|uniref:hypothetical protein n=1 Tax=Sphingobacterium siyangense TaxID=459529 RepID=UPI003DA693EB